MQVPYPQVAACSLAQRHAHMAHALTLGLPRLQPVTISEANRTPLCIAAYGPSLRDTWRQLTHPLISMSGATHWLAERGVIPDYHVDMDPRQNKVADVDPPVPGVHYLMASVCCPEVFAKLDGQRVTLWHVYSGHDDGGRDTYDWVAEHDPHELVLHAGSTIGLTALHIGGLLGYRHLEVHGMDGSFADLTRTARHAGPHTGHKQNTDGITWDAGGQRYATSKIMANAVTETLQTVKHFPMFAVFHGSGLTQALIKEANYPNACCADETEKADRVRRSYARLLPLPPVGPKVGVASLWDALLSQPAAGAWFGEAMRICREADARRANVRLQTGTIPLETALLLRAFTAYYQPQVAVEIGTYIGTSTHALQAAHVFTCDRNNDATPATDRIHTYPMRTSSSMLRELVDRGVRVDCFFFDGRLQPGDCALIEKLAHPQTVYAFDDYVGMEKGVINAGKLLTQLPDHVLIEPYRAFAGRSTLAALVPLRSA